MSRLSLSSRLEKISPGQYTSPTNTQNATEAQPPLHRPPVIPSLHPPTNDDGLDCLDAIFGDDDSCDEQQEHEDHPKYEEAQIRRNAVVDAKQPVPQPLPPLPPLPPHPPNFQPFFPPSSNLVYKANNIKHTASPRNAYPPRVVVASYPSLLATNPTTSAPTLPSSVYPTHPTTTLATADAIPCSDNDDDDEAFGSPAAKVQIARHGGSRVDTNPAIAIRDEAGGGADAGGKKKFQPPRMMMRPTVQKKDAGGSSGDVIDLSRCDAEARECRNANENTNEQNKRGQQPTSVLPFNGRIALFEYTTTAGGDDDHDAYGGYDARTGGWHQSKPPLGPPPLFTRGEENDNNNEDDNEMPMPMHVNGTGNDQPWWILLPDFVPVSILSTGWNPRDKSEVYIDYRNQFSGKSGGGATKASKEATRRRAKGQGDGGEGGDVRGTIGVGGKSGRNAHDAYGPQATGHWLTIDGVKTYIDAKGNQLTGRAAYGASLKECGKKVPSGGRKSGKTSTKATIATATKKRKKNSGGGGRGRTKKVSTGPP